MSSSPTPDGFDPWHFIHFLWAALGGLAVWIGKNQVRRLDRVEEGKVDKGDVDQLRDDIAAWKETQEDMHAENRQLLNQILLMTSRFNGRNHDV